MKGVVLLVAIILLVNLVYSFENTYPEEYAKEIEYVMEKYPELNNTRISFKISPIKTTMTSRPKVNFLVKKKENREYLITINSGGKGFEAKMLPFELRVGILSHELAHILNYEKMNKVQIIVLGFQYSLLSKQEFEKNMDIIAINRGFGEGIHKFTRFVLENNETSENYRNYKIKNYFSAEELKEMANFIEIFEEYKTRD